MTAGSALRVEVIDQFKERVFQLVQDFAASRAGCTYADVRIEVSESRYASAEGGKPKECGEDAEISFGARVLAAATDGGVVGPGYFGQTLGGSSIGGIAAVLQDGLDHAYQRARANARRKQEAERQLGLLANSLQSTQLARVEVCQDTVVFPFNEDPREVSLERMLRESTEATKLCGAIDARLQYSRAAVTSGLIRELFISTEGALIDQTYPLTQCFIYVVATGDGAPEAHYDSLGDLKGFEVVTGDKVAGKSFSQFAQSLARDALALAQAPTLPAGGKESIVITDPSYNALLVHEIVGHPVEADRALKMETGYAGRTWLYGGLRENMVGRRIASERVSAFSDPALQGLGHYRYDAEGVKARRVMHIDRGVFVGFMNGRESARIMGVEPNGSMRATESVYVPLVRMTNTVFAAGDSDPQQMIRDVEEGYYLEGHRIPSISESRENFRITARKIYKIDQGELTTLYRSSGLMADSKDFLMSIDAVGSDFKMYPIPNCGKGQPMQTMRVGNGGPTMRGRGTVVGGGH